MLASCLGCIYSGGGFKYVFTFTVILGEDEIHFDEHIFQGGWFNHLCTCMYIYSVFIPESSNGLKFGFQKPDCLGLKLDTQAEGPGMYVIDASEKGGMVEALLLVRGCALQGGPLLVKTRVITCYNPL